MSTEMILKIAKILVPVIIGLIIGGLIVGKIQQVRVNAREIELTKVKQELATKQRELTDCQDANATNQTTIGSMKAELQSVQAGVAKRLKQKERTANEIKRIDSLKPGVKTNEADRNTGSTGEPIIDDLNRMFINAGDPTDRKD